MRRHQKGREKGLIRLRSANHKGSKESNQQSFESCSAGTKGGSLKLAGDRLKKIFLYTAGTELLELDTTYVRSEADSIRRFRKQSERTTESRTINRY